MSEREPLTKFDSNLSLLERRRLSSALYRKRHPEKVRRIFRNNRLRRKYGMTIEDYERMVRQQNGLCLFCDKPKKLCIDHDHVDNHVRGLLCRDCNGHLGWVEKRLQRILVYIGVSK